MNTTLHQSPFNSSTSPNPCHPERSLAVSEASRQAESKDLVSSGSGTGDEGNFRIVVRFFHDEGELRPASRNDTGCEGPAQKCCVGEGKGTSPKGKPPLHRTLRMTQ